MPPRAISIDIDRATQPNPDNLSKELAFVGSAQVRRV